VVSIIIIALRRHLLCVCVFGIDMIMHFDLELEGDVERPWRNDVEHPQRRLLRQEKLHSLGRHVANNHEPCCRRESGERGDPLELGDGDASPLEHGCPEEGSQQPSPMLGRIGRRAGSMWLLLPTSPPEAFF
jgi:hypothetical protein